MSSSFSMVIDDFHNGQMVPLGPEARAGMPTLPYVDGNFWVITSKWPVSTDPPSATIATHPWARRPERRANSRPPALVREPRRAAGHPAAGRLAPARPQATEYDASLRPYRRPRDGGGGGTNRCGYRTSIGRSCSHRSCFNQARARKLCGTTSKIAVSGRHVVGRQVRGLRPADQHRMAEPHQRSPAVAPRAVCWQSEQQCANVRSGTQTTSA